LAAESQEHQLTSLLATGPGENEKLYRLAVSRRAGSLPVPEPRRSRPLVMT
jgi:hypothetical protein